MNILLIFSKVKNVFKLLLNRYKGLNAMAFREILPKVIMNNSYLNFYCQFQIYINLCLLLMKFLWKRKPNRLYKEPIYSCFPFSRPLLSDRTFYHGGNIINHHFPIQYPLATCSYSAFDIWLLQLQSCIFNHI